MSIATREELINALHEASEIEHGLLIQYLYAAFSMRKTLAEGLTPEQQALGRKWQAAILRVAHDEMGHLGTVCRLLAAIGAGPRFYRPNMPLAQDYYPFSFDLLPFGDKALFRFLVFELPRGMPQPPPPGANLRPAGPSPVAMAAGAAPQPITFQFVGELYQKIADGFQALPEKELFIGPPPGPDDADWPLNIDMQLARDRQSALAAIKDIIEDGEGTDESRADSHYAKFERIRLDYFDHNRFAMARAVPENPATRKQRGTSGSVALITNPLGLATAELFNAAYGVMLLLLTHYFSTPPRPMTPIEQMRRGTLKLAAARIMSVAVRPLAEIVTEQPLADPPGPERAGPSFEIYSSVELSPYEDARWTILLERLDTVIAEANRLAPQVPRLASTGETLGFMRRDLAAAANGEF